MTSVPKSIKAAENAVERSADRRLRFDERVRTATVQLGGILADAIGYEPPLPIEMEEEVSEARFATTDRTRFGAPGRPPPPPMPGREQASGFGQHAATSYGPGAGGGGQRY